MHGCYWHRHPGCSRATIPKSNQEFWLAKFARNCERDRVACSDLEAAGFAVLVVWECETENTNCLYESLWQFANFIGHGIRV